MTKAYLGTRRRAKGAVEAKRARQHWRLQMILQHGYFCWKHRTIWLQYGKTMEDNGRHWILMSQSRVSLVLLKATCLAVKIPGCFHLSKGQLCLWTPRDSTPPAGYSSGCHKTRKDLQENAWNVATCGHLWPLVATCNSCGKIIKSSSSQWGLSLAFSAVLNCSQVFSTVAASQLLFGTVSSALATKTLSMGWASKGCSKKSKHGGHGFMEDTQGRFINSSSACLKLLKFHHIRTRIPEF